MQANASTHTMQGKPKRSRYAGKCKRSRYAGKPTSIHTMQAAVSTHAMHLCSSAELVRVLDVPGKAAVTASDMRVKEAPK